MTFSFMKGVKPLKNTDLDRLISLLTSFKIPYETEIDVEIIVISIEPQFREFATEEQDVRVYGNVDCSTGYVFDKETEKFIHAYVIDD